MGYLILLLNVTAVAVVILLFTKIVSGPFDPPMLNILSVVLFGLIATVYLKRFVTSKPLVLVSITISSLLASVCFILIAAAYVFVFHIWSH